MFTKTTHQIWLYSMGKELPTHYGKGNIMVVLLQLKNLLS